MIFSLFPSRTQSLYWKSKLLSFCILNQTQNIMYSVKLFLSFIYDWLQWHCFCIIFYSHFSFHILMQQVSTFSLTAIENNCVKCNKSASWNNPQIVVKNAWKKKPANCVCHTQDRRRLLHGTPGQGWARLREHGSLQRGVQERAPRSMQHWLHSRLTSVHHPSHTHTLV